MDQEKRIRNLEDKVSILEDAVKTMIEEFRKFNMLADQIGRVVEEADKAVSVLVETNGTEGFTKGS